MSVVLSRYLYFPLTEAFKGTPVTRYLQELEKSQWCSLKDIEARGLEKLAETLEAALREVPFYQQSLGRCGKIDRQTARKVLEGFPVLKSEHIHLQGDALRARGKVGKVLRGSLSFPSSSEVETFPFFFTPEFLARTESAQWRGRAWWGMRRGDPLVALWGREPSDPQSSWLVAWRERRRNWLRLPAFELTHRDLKAHVKRIEKFKPRYIYGYSSAVYQLAAFYSEHAIPPPPHLRAIFFTADVLGGFQRRIVERTLKAPAVCEVGSSEVGAFAFECREGGIHGAVENVYLEVLRDGTPVPPEEEGDLVVTVLHNRAMPLIRWDLGNRARLIPDRCSCGRYLPRLEFPGAQKERVFALQGGMGYEAVFDHILMELIDRGLGGIRQFLVVQKGLDRFLVQVVPAAGLSTECLDLLGRRIRDRLGEESVVEFEIVPEIPRDPSGKIRRFRSEIAQPESGQQPSSS